MGSISTKIDNPTCLARDGTSFRVVVPCIYGFLTRSIKDIIRWGELQAVVELQKSRTCQHLILHWPQYSTTYRSIRNNLLPIRNSQTWSLALKCQSCNSDALVRNKQMSIVIALQRSRLLQIVGNDMSSPATCERRSRIP